jgi:hypothetical protein
MPLELAVGRDLQPPLTEREARAIALLLVQLRTSLRRRLPLTLELVELDVELRRSCELEVVKSAHGRARERR